MKSKIFIAAFLLFVSDALFAGDTFKKQKYTHFKNNSKNKLLRIDGIKKKNIPETKRPASCTEKEVVVVNSTKSEFLKTCYGSIQNATRGNAVKKSMKSNYLLREDTLMQPGINELRKFSLDSLYCVGIIYRKSFQDSYYSGKICRELYSEDLEFGEMNLLEKIKKSERMEKSKRIFKKVGYAVLIYAIVGGLIVLAFQGTLGLIISLSIVTLFIALDHFTR